MRVTGGVARGRRLKRAPAGVRPTSELVRSALFDALASQDAGLARVLDLYAGTGALGIEALSRGDGRCDFVERDAASAALIKENLRLTGLDARAKVHRRTVERAIERLEGPYTLVLADPPYDDPAAERAVERVAGSSLVAPGVTTLVLEQSSRRAAPEALGPLRLAWSRRYGDTLLAVYR